ncbi:MAG: MOSC domain-containing protein [Arcobacteraceae bacterium]|nr:MOSC domain-containing protein [Arcobacteraceae bacterium]
MKNVEVQYIFSGKKQSYKIKSKEFQSGYIKREAYTTAYISKEGIKEDEQADSRYHGGVDKALLIASTNHCQAYEKEFDEPIDIAIFSANILLNELDESSVCVGDIYSIGEVQLQVTQPRQPCWKIGAVFSPSASQFIKQHSATGWYVRVLQEGNISLNDSVKLIERKSAILIKDMTQYLDSKTIEKNILDMILAANFVAQSYKNDISKVTVI